MGDDTEDVIFEAEVRAALATTHRKNPATCRVAKTACNRNNRNSPLQPEDKIGLKSVRNDDGTIETGTLHHPMTTQMTAEAVLVLA